jgi:hypothetical protein
MRFVKVLLPGMNFNGQVIGGRRNGTVVAVTVSAIGIIRLVEIQNVGVIL